jgi:hypothetical protein
MGSSAEALRVRPVTGSEEDHTLIHIPYVGIGHALYSAPFSPETGVAATPTWILPSQYYHAAITGIYARGCTT